MTGEYTITVVLWIMAVSAIIMFVTSAMRDIYSVEGDKAREKFVNNLFGLGKNSMIISGSVLFISLLIHINL